MTSLKAPPPAEAVRTELVKVLTSPAFANAERLSRFLKFAVEQALAGRGEQLKESLVGVEVFDRDASYLSGQVQIRKPTDRLPYTVYRIWKWS